MSQSITRSESIIFIGPEGTGKTTIGKIIAKTLSKELYSLDRHRDELYAPFNYDKALADRIYEEQGSLALLEYWKFFEFQAVQYILQNAHKDHEPFHGKILDFGAGHSIYDKPEQLARVAELMEPYDNVVLILPCEDVGEALQITEARRGHELPYNKHFLEHKSNRTLAKHIVYTKNQTPEESAQTILQILQRDTAEE